MKFIIIGITDDPKPFFPPTVRDIIRHGRVFSGGKRHYEIVAPLLPPDATWITITTPLDTVFEQYVEPEVIVFASGDPLFFGFANTVRRKMPTAEVVLFPSFNSLQTLAHRLVMPYHEMRTVSLTGRPWPEFDRALIERTRLIGVLTDREHTPAAIARRMLDYGYTYYYIYVGEHLGHPVKEHISKLTLEEAALCDFDHPNCILLAADATRPKPFGIPDAAFSLLDGREKMITKMPLRLLTLQALNLPRRHVLWDIGFCTGSVSIEARLQFPHLQVVAFEIRPECEQLMHDNSRRFGAPGINTVISDFLTADLTHLPPPDAVFIGGHGGRLKDVIAKVLTVLTDDGIIVFNSVSSAKVPNDSQQLWNDACRELSLQQAPPLHIQLDHHNPITVLKANKQGT